MLLLAVPAAVVTALVAAIVRSERVGLGRRAATIVAVGTTAPLGMLLWGAWHLRGGGEPTDMIPPGPGLLIAALPAAALCLLVSWLILRRR